MVEVLVLFHHGMVVLGVPYSEAALMNTHSGGTPYGASHVAGADNSCELSQHECDIARALGRHPADIATHLHGTAS